MATTTTTTTTTDAGVTTTQTETVTMAAVCPPCQPAKRAVLGCKCGKVEISFANFKPRMHALCSCINCNDAFRWAESKGGPAKGNPCSDSWYWDNDMKVERGDEHIGFYLLGEGYKTIRLVTSCCHSTLLGDHEFYGGNHVIVYGDCVKSCEYLPLCMNLFMCDLTKEQEAFALKLGPVDLPHVYKFEDILEGGPHAELGGWFMSLFEIPCPTPIQGVTVQQLIEKHGVTTLDWKPTNDDAREFTEAYKANLALVGVDTES